MTTQEFLTSLANGSTWSAGVAFKRSNPLPIDRYSVFAKEADVDTYIKTNAVAYPGQIVASLQSAAGGDAIAVYVITAVGTAGKKVQLASTTVTGDVTADLNALSEAVTKIEDRLGLNIEDDTRADLISILPVGTPVSEATVLKVLQVFKDYIDELTTRVNGKVNEVKAADASVVTSLSSEPLTGEDGRNYKKNTYNVRAQISTKTGNRLQLSDDSTKPGLYVPPVPAQTDYTVTVGATATPTAGMLKTYDIQQCGKSIGKIDIPKDFLVKSGSVKTATTANKPVDGLKVGDPYIELILNTKDTAAGSEANEAIYIPVSSLVEYVTSGSTDNDQVIVVVDPTTHKVTATIGAEKITATELAPNSVTTAKIKDKNVTKAKLADDVVTSLGKADSAVQSVSLAPGSENGTLELSVNDAGGGDVKVTGLDTAAYRAALDAIDSSDAAGIITDSKYKSVHEDDLVSLKALVKYADTLYVGRWSDDV